MKKVFTFASIAICTLAASSCKKCAECTLVSAVITDEVGNKYYLWTDGTVRSLPEGHKSSAAASTFGITCQNDLEDCIDGVYREYCGADKKNVEQVPYIVSGVSSTDSIFTAEYTYDCK